MISSFKLYLLTISFVLGVGMVPFVQTSVNAVYVFLLIIGAYSIALNKRNVFIILLCICAVIGCARFNYVLGNPAKDALVHDIGKKLTIKGIVIKEPVATEYGVNLVVQAESIQRDEMWNDSNLLFKVSTSFYPEYVYGDEVEIRGNLSVPKDFEKENGKTFNYRNYLAKDGIFYEFKKPYIKTTGHLKGNWLKEKLFSFKYSFLTNIEVILPEPQSALAGGLVLGVKQSLGKELEEKFRKTGIIHIVVLSGYNVTIIAESFMKALSFLPQHIGSTAGIIGIIFFAIITGGTATVVRSSIMAVILVVSRSRGKQYDASRALCVAGAGMIFHNPYILLYDPSFQLSFLATLGLMLISQHIEPFFMWVTENFGMRTIFTSTFATQIFVLPYILYQIGEISIIGLVVNILVLPLIPFTMLGVFLTGMVGFVYQPFSFIFSSFTYFFLAYEVLIVELFAELKFASLSVHVFPLWMVVVLYILYAFALMYIHRRKKLISKH